MMNSKHRILFAVSDYSFSLKLKTRLENEYYVSHCHDGETAWKEFNKKLAYSLCLFEVEIPRKNGFELTSKIRSVNQSIPILFVSERASNEDIINGFKHGGDDYIPKSCSVQELLCRIRVFIRRTSNVTQYYTENCIAKVGNSIFNYLDHNLTDLQGNEIATFTKTEAKLMRYLCRNSNRRITREEILLAIWAKNDHFASRSLDVFMTKLRKVFSTDSTVTLETLRGTGIRFNIPPDLSIQTTFDEK